MKTIKTRELTGAALDWAVAKCEGEDARLVKGQLETRWTENGWAPSANWSQGGPIIEREIHAFDHMQSDRICAMIKRKDMQNGGWNHGYGPTPLIAAMRCYVASKLGDTVEIPEELTCAT